jgi:hypothetical protein
VILKIKLLRIPQSTRVKMTPARGDFRASQLVHKQEALHFTATLLPLIPLLDPSFSPPRPRSLLTLTMIGSVTLVLAMFAAGAQCELGQGVVRRRPITHT